MKHSLVATCLLATALLAVSLAARAAGGTTTERPDSLASEVEALLGQRAAAAFPAATIAVRTLPLDPRLRLAACNQLDLQPRSDNVYGRVPVAVRCLAPAPWSVFLTGEVSVTLPVVVARGPLRRGTTLGATDVRLEPKDLAGLRSHYLTDTADAAGLETKAPVAPGGVIYATLLKEPLAVRRGERVTILAKRGAVNIQASGEALQDGLAGAQIRVRNRQSQRTVSAWVQGPGVVATSP